MPDDDLTRALAAWREAVAETDAVRGAAQLWHPGDQVMIQHAEHRECRAGRAYLAALDQRAEEPHAAHAGAPMTSRRACGCVRVQCDVCMDVLRDTYCSVHRPTDLAALDRQAGVHDAG